MPTQISQGSLTRTILVILALPLSAVAQTPVTEPVVVTPAASHGFCDSKYVPLTPESVRVAFREAAARQGVARFLTNVGLGKLSPRVVGLLESGKMPTLTIDPKTVFAAYSAGRDGARGA